MKRRLLDGLLPTGVKGISLVWTIQDGCVLWNKWTLLRCCGPGASYWILIPLHKMKGVRLARLRTPWCHDESLQRNQRKFWKVYPQDPALHLDRRPTV